jgi:hypothetical protein
MTRVSFCFGDGGCWLTLSGEARFAQLLDWKARRKFLSGIEPFGGPSGNTSNTATKAGGLVASVLWSTVLYNASMEK